MFTGIVTEVDTPLGEVTLTVTAPDVVPTAKLTETDAYRASVELETGEPPTTAAAMPVVPDALTVLPAATGLMRTGFASATRKENTGKLAM